MAASMPPRLCSTCSSQTQNSVQFARLKTCLNIITALNQGNDRLLLLKNSLSDIHTDVTKRIPARNSGGQRPPYSFHKIEAAPCTMLQGVAGECEVKLLSPGMATGSLQGCTCGVFTE